MNKAFLKEAESSGGRCPKCGSLGLAVPQTTVQIWGEYQAGDLSDAAYFCESPNCPVAYFDDFERSITTDALKRPVWPKDPAAPLCGCFGLTAEDIAADVRENGVARVRDVVQRAKSPEARCASESPTGQSCIAAVQRYYFRLREQSSK